MQLSVYRGGSFSGWGGIVWGASGLEKMGGGLDGGTMSYVTSGLSVWWWYKEWWNFFFFL